MEDSVEHTQENVTNDVEPTQTTETSRVDTSLGTTQGTDIRQEESIVAEPAKTVQEPTYSIKEFIDNAKALGYRKEVVTGALFNCEKTELTKSEFEETIKNFLGKKVK